MSETTEGGFCFDLPLTKAWQDDRGQMWFAGRASSPARDRQRDRMSPAALQRLSGCRGLDLLPGHRAGPLEALGTVEQCWAEPQGLRVTGTLEPDNPQARLLFRRLQQGRPYGLSVGGRVTAAHWETDPDDDGPVRVIDAVQLDHIAVCRAQEAVNPETYLVALAKAAEQVAPAERPADLLGRLRAALSEIWQELVGGELPLPPEPAEEPTPEAEALPAEAASQPDSAQAAPEADSPAPEADDAEADDAEADSAHEEEPVPEPSLAELQARLAALEARLIEKAADDEPEPPLPGQRRSLALAGPLRPEQRNLWRGVL